MFILMLSKLFIILSLAALVTAYGGEPVINFVTDAGIRGIEREGRATRNNVFFSSVCIYMLCF